MERMRAATPRMTRKSLVSQPYQLPLPGAVGGGRLSIGTCTPGAWCAIDRLGYAALSSSAPLHQLLHRPAHTAAVCLDVQKSNEPTSTSICCDMGDSSTSPAVAPEQCYIYTVDDVTTAVCCRTGGY